MTLHLSRLRLHPRDPLVARDLGDAVELHRTVMRAFPQHDGADPRTAFGVLFRVESALRPPPGRGGETPELLVQSMVAPDWTQLPVGYVLDAAVRSADALLDGIAENRRLRFRLLGNATRKTAAVRPGEEPRRHSRRVPLDTDEERRSWIDRRAERAGFTVVGDVSDLRIDALPPWRQRRDNGVTVRPVLYEGRLEVRDPVAFRDALRSGIGPAKAYGCGLLSVAPA
ncbi:MAG: type I-E CRISPR-associated protein Cas6/Cse3/CasE [Solirubrobacteraceae bacterium]